VRRFLLPIALLAAMPLGASVEAGAATTEPPDPMLDLPDGVSVGVEFPRYLMVQRQLEAIVDNQSETDIIVVDVALRSPLFEPVEPDVHDYPVAAGRRQDLRMGVGESICPPADEPSMIEMTVEIDGERRHGLAEIDISPISKINTRECGERFVFEHANVEWGPEFSVDDGVLTTTVTLTRRDGNETMSVTAVRGTVLYLVLAAGETSDGTPLGTMVAGESSGSAPVVMRVGRCEPHAVADVKKPYSFGVWVTIGDSEPYPIELLPGEEIKAALAELLQECIAADDG
jgi:hypothetical protein